MGMQSPFYYQKKKNHEKDIVWDNYGKPSLYDGSDCETIARSHMDRGAD